MAESASSVDSVRSRRLSIPYMICNTSSVGWTSVTNCRTRRPPSRASASAACSEGRRASRCSGSPSCAPARVSGSDVVSAATVAPWQPWSFPDREQPSADRVPVAVVGNPSATEPRLPEPCRSWRSSPPQWRRPSEPSAQERGYIIRSPARAWRARTRDPPMPSARSEARRIVRPRRLRQRGDARRPRATNPRCSAVVEEGPQRAPPTEPSRHSTVRTRRCSGHRPPTAACEVIVSVIGGPCVQGADDYPPGGVSTW